MAWVKMKASPTESDPKQIYSYDGTCENGFDSEFGLRTIILHEILVRKLEERVWKEENQRGKHIPGYGGFLPMEENSPANDVMLPRYHDPDMEEWGGKTPKYCGHKPKLPCHENPGYMWNLDHSRNNHYTTTYGQANQMTIQTAARLKKRPPIVRPLWPHEDPNAKRGVKGFFYEDPRLESSEEGKQVEKYFAIVRPWEGTLMAMNSNKSIKSAVMM